MRKLLPVIFVFIIGGSSAQTPYPIDLGIQNIAQETNSWCWAAVSQQIIYWIKGYSPSQCQLVANAYNVNAQYCCSNPQGCNTAGNMQQIQSLIYTYGGRYSAISPPANEIALYNTLSQRKAIIIFLQTTPYIGHFIVLRGMAWLQTQFGLRPVVYINDPMAHFAQSIYFSQLVALWRAAIVVY